MRLAPSGDPGRRARRVVLVGFALVTVWFTGAFPPFANPNELSRLETVYAIVEQGTFRIDEAVRVLGDHEDKAVSGGHVYSNKAPGLALAAVPVYRLLRCVFPAPRSPFAPLFLHVLPLLTVSALCVVALARLATRLFEEAPRGAAATLAAIAFGTPFLYYARTFFGHAWSAALLFLAWDVLRLAERRSEWRRVALAFIGAGFLAGWAFLSEYTVLPVVLCLVLRAGAGRAWRRLALFSAGAAVPILVLLAYQWACFGAPWVPSYAREAYPRYAELAGQPLLGFGWPSPSTLLDFLVHPSRGVLVFSPFLAWAAWGLFVWWRSRQERPDCGFVIGSLIFLPVVLSAYPNWHGGWSLGSRYLVPLVLIAALPVARALESRLSRGLFLAAAAFSIGQFAILTLTWPSFPLDVPWPVASGSLWFLERGWVALRIGPPGFVGDVLSVALLFGVAAVALLAAIRASLPVSPRPELAAALGFVPLAILLARPPELGYSARLWRAGVFARYSGRDPSAAELAQVVAAAATPAEQRLAAGFWKAYGPGGPPPLRPPANP